MVHFDRGIHLFAAIDHIAFSGTAGLAGPPTVLRERSGPVWPSDHSPVAADVTLGAR